MDTRIDNLISLFENCGWERIGETDMSNDWWFENIYELRSAWKPLNSKLFLTLLTDPQFLNKKVVWCIGFSTVIPDSSHFNYLEQITLNDIKKADLNLFVKNVNTLVRL